MNACFTLVNRNVQSVQSKHLFFRDVNIAIRNINKKYTMSCIEKATPPPPPPPPKKEIYTTPRIVYALYLSRLNFSLTTIVAK